MPQIETELITSLVFLVLFAIPMSVMLFLAYKISKIQYKKPKYGRFRRKYVLWNLIFLKSIILVPIVRWILDAIGKMIFGFSMPSGFWGLSVAWIIWCVIISVYRTLYRKIFRKSSGREQEKSPTPFYNNKK